MSGKISSRINEDTLALLQGQGDYLDPFLKNARTKAKDEQLSFRLGGEQARTFPEKLPNGKFRINFSFPIDNNGDATDGRLFVVDSYTFEDANQKNFSFHREVFYNQRGEEKGKWRALRDFLNNPINAPLPTPEQQAKFVQQIALSFSRPIESSLHKKIKSFVSEEIHQLGSEQEVRYFSPILKAGKKGKLKLRLKDAEKLRDRRSHISYIPKQTGYEVVLSYVLDGEDPKKRGCLVVQDRFVFLNMDEPVSFRRELVVANGSPPEEHWDEIRKKFYQEDGVTLLPELMPNEAGWKKFFSQFKKDLLHLEPDFTTLQADLEKEFVTEQGPQQVDAVSVEDAMARMVENQRYRPVTDYENTLSQVLMQQRGYLNSLARAGGQEFPLELDHLPLDIQVKVVGEETLVKLRYRFADPSFDGVPRGQVTLTETLRFKEKNLEGVERETDFTGPDPDGRLTAVYSRLKENLGSFPDKANPFTKHFLNQILSYVAPHVLVKPGESAVLATPGESAALEKKGIGVSSQEKESLESLKKIGEGLVPYLYDSKVDPKFCIPILRAIREKLYRPDQPKTDEQGQPVEEQGANPIQILMELGSVEMKRLEPLLSQLEPLLSQQEILERQPNLDANLSAQLKNTENLIAQLKDKIGPIQDRAMLVETLFNIITGRSDKAVHLVPKFASPQLRSLMERTLGPLQRKKLNHDGLEQVEVVALDLIAKEARESDRWFGGKPFNQAEAEKSLRSLMEKAQVKAETEDHKSPLAVIESLKDLNDGEKAERRRLLTHPLVGQLNQIAQDTVRDSQGRRYFTFARRNLMDAGLVTSANYLSKWVALNLMPPTRSLEGLNVLTGLLETQLELDLNQNQQKQILELSKITWPLQNPEGLTSLPPEEAQAIQQEFQEKYGELKTQADQDFSLLTDFQKFFALDETGRNAFIQRITQAFGPQVLSDQATLYYTRNMLAKLEEGAGKNPDQNFQDLLLKVGGLDAGEAKTREGILQEPLIAAILEANKEPTPEDRRKAYLAIFAKAFQNPNYRPLVMNLAGLLQKEDFPKERSKEGLLLVYSVMNGMISTRIAEATSKPLTEKIQKDLNAKGEEVRKDLLKEIFLRSQAQQIILEKAREKAVSRPETSPLEIMALITDEELNKDLEEIIQKLNPHEPSFDAKKEELKKIYWEAKGQRKLLSGKPIMTAVAKIFGEANAVRRRDGYKKLFNQTMARDKGFQIILGQATGEIEEVPEEEMNKIFEMANYSSETKAKLDALKKIKDQNALQALVVSISKEADFQFQPFIQAMTALNGTLERGELVTASAQEVVEATPSLKEEEKEAILMGGGGRFPSHAIADFIAYTEGHGSVGYKIEQGVPRIFHEVTQPTGLAAMTGAMWLGPAVEAGILIRAGGLVGQVSPWASGAAAAGSVFAGGLMLNTGQKLLDSAFITRKGQWDNWWGDQKTTWLTFALWGGAQGLVGQIGREILATGKAGRWAGGPVVVKEVPTVANATGRLRIPAGAEQGAVYQTTRAGAMAEGLAQHGAGISAIMTSHALAPVMGWQPKNQQKGFVDTLFDATNFYVTGLVGAKIAQGLPTGGLTNSIASMRHHSEMLKLQQKMGEAKAEPGVPELVDHKVFTEHLEALQKKAEEIFREKAIPTLPAEIPALRQTLEGLLGSKAMEAIEFKVEAGKIWIKDSREGVTKGRNDIEVDGNHLVHNQWVTVPENTVIKTHEGEFRLGQVKQDGISPAQLAEAQMLQTLAEVPLAKQYSLARVIESAKDLAGLQKSLESFRVFLLKHWVSAANFQLAPLLRFVQTGAYPLEALPSQLGLRNKVTELMELEVASAKQDGLDIEALEWSEGNLPRGMDPVQFNFIKARFVRQLDEAIARAKSVEEIVELFSKSPIKKIEGRTMEQLRADFSNQAQGINPFGLRQKVLDLAQDPAAIPDLPPTITLNRLVRKHLDPRAPDDLAATQTVLRYHLDRMTPKARVMLSRNTKLGGLTPVQRKGLVDLYLGVEGERVIPSVPRGLQIIGALGKGGYSYPMSLSHGAGRTVLQKGLDYPQDCIGLAKAKDKTLEITPWADHDTPLKSDLDLGAPTGWNSAWPYVPKIPPLPATVRMPRFEFPKKILGLGLGTLWRGRKPAEAKDPTGDREKIDQEVEKVFDEYEASPETSASPKEAADSSVQSKGQLQVKAINNLHQALAKIGRYTDNQEVNVEVEVGGRVIELNFKIHLTSKQVQITEHAITDLQNARDGVDDPKVKVLYDALIDLKGQAFELPISVD